MSGKLTSSLLQAAAGLDAWALYHFMTTPHGRLRGLRPFEALIGPELLAPLQRTSRMALAALRAEAAEHPAA